MLGNGLNYLNQVKHEDTHVIPPILHTMLLRYGCRTWKKFKKTNKWHICGWELILRSNSILSVYHMTLGPGYMFGLFCFRTISGWHFRNGSKYWLDLPFLGCWSILMARNLALGLYLQNRKGHPRIFCPHDVWKF